jgi:hypothetical protein
MLCDLMDVYEKEGVMFSSKIYWGKKINRLSK